MTGCCARHSVYSHDTTVRQASHLQQASIYLHTRIIAYRYVTESIVSFNDKIVFKFHSVSMNTNSSNRKTYADCDKCETEKYRILRKQPFLVLPVLRQVSACVDKARGERPASLTATAECERARAPDTYLVVARSPAVSRATEIDGSVPEMGRH
ncbi:hypothetical protein J6590_011261 [Homalodisca vitripennis]|nr:hypothetical protein J6590_011261 [Homalodisca vitripennis]